jgi:hypothetical protein
MKFGKTKHYQSSTFVDVFSVFGLEVIASYIDNALKMPATVLIAHGGSDVPKFVTSEALCSGRTHTGVASRAQGKLQLM